MNHRLAPLALLGLCVAACDPGGAGVASPPSDAGGGAGPGDGAPRADFSPDIFSPDVAATDAGADADAGPICACQAASDCAEGSFCDACQCRPVPEAFVHLPPADGVSRAAAAAFDLTPGYMEPWSDRAGPDCPDNRPGRFDGRLDRPEPEDPCRDTFNDANGDGLMAAVWLGGGASDRPAAGVDNTNPPQGRVLVIARDDQLWVVVTLDVYAVEVDRIRTLARALRNRLGVRPEQLAVHATGNRSGPDTVGLWGPSLEIAAGERAEALRALGRGALGLVESVPFASGVDERWWAEVLQRCVAAVDRAGSSLQPVQMRAATVELPLDEDPPLDGPIELPDGDGDGVLNSAQDRFTFQAQQRWLSRDTRIPVQRDRRLRALALDTIAGEAPLAVLLGWGAAPATTAPQAILSADFPGVARAIVETTLPGSVAIWLTSAAEDTVIADSEAFIPEVDEQGRFLDAAGEPTDNPLQIALASDRAQALGTLLARRALEALRVAEPEAVQLSVASRFAWVPLTNPRFGLAARLGLLPVLGDWLSGRASTTAWSSGTETPACGGLGCIRYRIDRVVLGQGVELLTTPGALDDSFVQGRGAGSIAYGDQRSLLDVDGDGVLDDEDSELRIGGEDAGPVITFPGPLNPQRFGPVASLVARRPRTWVIGRTNGGVGSLRSAEEHVNVFEGAVEALRAFTAPPRNAALDLCGAGYPCAGPLPAGDLLERLLQDQPALLADVKGRHELWLVEASFETASEPLPWRLEDSSGALKYEGQGLVLGPGALAFTLEDLQRLPALPEGERPVVARGDRVVVPDLQADVEVGGIVPVRLALHPNAGDAWTAASGGGGDLVYNTACELLWGDRCPHHRAPPQGQDPNQTLPREP